MVRRIVGVVAGVVIANLLIFGWERLAHRLAIGGAIDTTLSPEALTATPLALGLWVAAGWLIGTFLGALVAFRAGRWDYAGWIVAGLIAAAGIANVLKIAHPFWMALSAVALPFVGALFAFGVYRRMRAADLHLRR